MPLISAHCIGNITSLYFEGTYTDSELVTCGYSRDHRPDCKQINLETDVTHDGYVPVLYQALAYRPQGVKADESRFVPYQGVWWSFIFEAEGETFTDRALVVWSAGKQCLDEQKRKIYLKRLLNQLTNMQGKTQHAALQETQLRGATFGECPTRQSRQGVGRYPVGGWGGCVVPDFPYQRYSAGASASAEWALCSGYERRPFGC